MGRRKTKQEFEKEFNELSKGEYSLMEDYKGWDTKIFVKHNVCGHIYSVRPNNFLNGKRCPKCSNEDRDNRILSLNHKSHEMFLKEIRDKYGDEYIILGEYINNSTPILVKHTICGNEYEVRPGNLLQGKQCKVCAIKNASKKKTRTQEQFEKEVFKQVGDEYSAISEYTKVTEKVKMRHNKCGHEWYITPNNFLNHEKRCPVCASSKGEILIQKWLENNNINFIRQDKFEDCKDERPLPFDFVIYDNDKIKLIIEFDGIQHFEPTTFGGISYEKALENYEVCKIHDNIKNKYCKDNKIKLLRISYKKFNDIENILKDHLIP